MSANILGFGCAHPTQRMDTTRWLALATAIAPPRVDRALLQRLADRSGIAQRWCAAATDNHPAGFYAPQDASAAVAAPVGTAARVRLWASTVRPMAFAACRDAMRASAMNPASITHLVTASCTGFAAPGMDQWLIRDLDLAPSVRRTNIGFMGCHAAINAVAVARDMVRADPTARVLVCCGEVCSAHLHYGERVDQWIANTLFGDGAAAVVVAASAEDKHSPTRAAIQIIDTHSLVIEGSDKAMTWEVGDNGFMMGLSAEVPALIERALPSWIDARLAESGLCRASVAGWAIHPGGPRVIDSVVAALGLPADAGDASRGVLRDFGNMSSATLLFILERLVCSGASGPVVALAFGPGLSAEMLLVSASTRSRKS